MTQRTAAKRVKKIEAVSPAEVTPEPVIVTEEPPVEELVEALDAVLRHTDWEINSVIDHFTDKAKELGEQYNANRKAYGQPLAPLAYQASFAWQAVEIIQQLQADLAYQIKLNQAKKSG